MGLFSSKSKSTSTSNYTDTSTNTSGTVGDLSSGNIIVSGDYQIDGLNKEMADSVISSIKEIAGEAINQTASAYSGANASIVATSDQTRSFLSSLQPLALIVAGAFAVWAVWGHK